jgi:predicted nucleic acid-binding protein
VILLDTNVVSELLRNTGAGPVHAWLDRQARDVIATSAVTVFEVRHGIARLPEGARRRMLEASLHRLFVDDWLLARIEALDGAAAEAAALLAAERFRRGRPVDLADTLIAGIALARGAAVATRNTRHFEDIPGLVVIDPWAA